MRLKRESKLQTEQTERKQQLENKWIEKRKQTANRNQKLERCKTFFSKKELSFENPLMTRDWKEEKITKMSERERMVKETTWLWTQKIPSKYPI